MNVVEFNYRYIMYIDLVTNCVFIINYIMLYTEFAGYCLTCVIAIYTQPYYKFYNKFDPIRTSSKIIRKKLEIFLNSIQFICKGFIADIEKNLKIEEELS